MHFAECNEGDYRIYAGARETEGGYVAAVVVNRLRGVLDAPKEAFRDTSMSGGHRWTSAIEALNHARRQAQKIIRREPQRLNC